ncbi:MAG: carbon-nitrogen hydrolase family protein [Xanthomonadales bacterium]|jgi:nitrilase|nr:carbon-nitrogen hydrolase family protein [Xanthomonadales bacterium]MDH3925641.1 carbon-nitrogen hydrolase family protein [Xanthomonadales bacterium]MDH3940970.1 carbon-nitrogen hydrolase family protein [Xanthomonadales bacterium]MDH4000294.1 carbon-nitrogen hydrolase family protein [Xanthomonadales bacterium]
MNTVKVAVVQAASVLFDKPASVKKACELVEQAGQNGGQIVVLPEAFIPAYPRGFAFGMKIGSRNEEGRALWQRYWDNSLDIAGPEVQQLGEAAARAGVFLAIGVIEREGQSAGETLYCSMLYFSPAGELLGKHRKLKPTGSERLIWGEGDGSTLPVFSTEHGKIGGLICWENYMPLARMALYAQGVEIYLAPTADSRDNWQSTVRHIACEGRCFVLGCNQFVTRSMYPPQLEAIHELEDQPAIMCRGGSVIVAPTGEVLAGPLWDEEGILYADLDMDEITRAKIDFDVVGHYARPDIFQLKVNHDSQDSVTFGSLHREPSGRN